MKKITAIFLLIAVISFSIVIKTNEKGVEVYVNNTLKYVVDGTSLVLNESKKGDLKLTLPGYWPVDFEVQNVDLSSTDLIEVNFYPKIWGKIAGISELSKIFIINGTNEIYIGKQPYEGWLPLGKHTFKVITPEGYIYTIEKNITESATTVNLFKEYSRIIRIESSPESEVYIDGVFIGKTPVFVKLTYEKHYFKFYKKGFFVGEGEVKIKDDGIEVLKSSGKASKGSDYIIFHVKNIVKVTLSSIPEGAFIKMERNFYRLPKTLELPEGTNVAEVTLPGYLSKKVTFDPSEGPLIRFNLTPDQKIVDINFDGKVFVNNKRKGLGPLSLNLLKGIYIMKFESGENKWLMLTDVATNMKINVSKNSGTLVIGDIGIIKLNGNTILTPTILNLSPGNYELTLTTNEGTNLTETITIERGKVIYYPKDVYFVVINTSPPAMQIKLNNKPLTTPVFLYPVKKEIVSIEFIYKCRSVKKEFKLEKNKINYIFQSFRINPFFMGKEKEKENCEISLEEE